MASRRLTSRASSSLLTLLATGVLLTACMDDTTNGPASGASPSSVGNPSSENNSAANYLYASTNVMDGSGNFTGQQINLVDPSTGTLLKSVAVDTSSTQMAAQAFTVSSDGLSTQAGNDVVLYYTNGGKVYALGLSKPASPGNGQQVSSESQACGLIKVIPKDASATKSWLLINTAGTDGQCDTASDNEVKLASSDASDATAAIVVGNSSQEIRLIDTQRDSSGKLVNVIASVRTNDGNGNTISTKLVAISASTGGQTDVVNGTIAAVHDINDTSKLVVPTVSFFGRVAGSSNQIYVRVGQDVQVLSWASGTPTLQTSVVTALANADVPFVHTDGQATYVVDGSSVKVLKPNVAASVLTSALPASAIVQASSAMSTSALVLITRNSDDSFGLSVVDKNPLSANAVTSVTWAGNTLPKIEAVNGDVVVLSAASAGANDVKLMRFNAAKPETAPTSVSGADHARVITTVHSATTTLSGETAGTHLVWCDATTACNASNVNSYQVVAGANLSLSGTGSTSPTWQLTNTLSRSTTLGLLGSSSQTGGADAPIWSSDSLWLFDAAKANSLSQVSLSSGS